MKLPARAHHRERNWSASQKDQMNISGWAGMTNGASKEPAWTGSWWQQESLTQGKIFAAYPDGAAWCLPSLCCFEATGLFPEQLASKMQGTGGGGSGVSPPCPWLPRHSGVPGRERWLSRVLTPFQHNTAFAKLDTCLCFCFWLVLLIFWSSAAKKVGTFASYRIIPFHYFHLLGIKHDLLKATWFNTKKRKTN